MDVYKVTFNYSSLCQSANQPDADNSNKLYLFFILAATVLRQIFINSGYKGRETKGSNCFYCVFVTIVSLCKSFRTLRLYLACNVVFRCRGTGDFNRFSFYPFLWRCAECNSSHRSHEVSRSATLMGIAGAFLRKFGKACLDSIEKCFQIACGIDWS